MNTLYDSLQSTQGITFLDDVMFTGVVVIPSIQTIATNVPIPTALTPPAGFINPVISTNQGPGAPQLYLFLRLLDVAVSTDPAGGDFSTSMGLTRQASVSQFFTSANVPASAVGNNQTFQFVGTSSEYTGKMFANILSRLQFFINANINVTKVQVGSDGVNYDNVNNPPGVLSSTFVQDYIGVFGSPGWFRPTFAPNGVYINVTVNNTAASIQQYTFAAFGSADINETLLFSIQYQDIAGSFHQLAFIDNKITTQNVPLNMLIQVPFLATTSNYGKIVVIPKNNFSPLNSTAFLSYALTATFAYMQTGGV